MLRSGIVLAVLSLALASVTWGQDAPATPSQEPASATPATPQDNSQQPATPTPGFGTEKPPAPVSENPPISGVDQPGLEPHGAPLSYVQFGGHLIESADSNPADTFGGGAGVHSVTSALGSVDLQRLWSNYDLAIDYVGGVGYVNVSALGFRQVQQLDVDQRITWKRGQLGLRDSFSYLPEGNFAGAYGTFNPEGQAGGGAISSQNVFLGGAVLGSLGQVSRIVNMATLDLVENLTPKSAVTATGAYSFVHYTGDNFVPTAQQLGGAQTGIGFLGTTQLAGQVGYDRILGPHDQVAIAYGYQNFDFAVSGLSFHSQLVQLMWGHRISGRMDFLIAAGPQFTSINLLEIPSPGTSISVPPCVNVTSGPIIQTECPTKDFRISGSGRASLRYKFPKTTLNLAYDRYITSGSGFFAGARSDIGRFSAARPLSRVWSVFGDLGYAKNVSEQPLNPLQAPCLQLNPIPTGCEGVNAASYSYGFIGFGLHRKIGHDFRVYGSYQFDYLSFDNSVCGTNIGACNRISQRQVGTIGLDWTPRPTRLD
jgi:hypothetical protein